MYFKNIFIDGPQVIELKKLEDERGFFARFWCKKELENKNIDFEIKQINNSLSLEKGTLRGLHFQYPPKSEGKIIRCLTGSIWDVIVDIRKNSKTFGKWFAIELNQNNKKMLYVPKGFAHGFISLSNNSLTRSSDTGVPTGLPYSSSHSVIKCPMPTVAKFK